MSIDVAVIGGLLGSMAAVLLLQIWEVARPSHNHIRVVTLIGSAFTQKPFWQQMSGRVVVFAVGACYGIFTSAVIYAFELEGIAWLSGACVSLLLWILTGVTLTYFRLLHPRIRKGRSYGAGSVRPRIFSPERRDAAGRSRDIRICLRRHVWCTCVIMRTRCRRTPT